MKPNYRSNPHSARAAALISAAGLCALSAADAQQTFGPNYGAATAMPALRAARQVKRNIPARFGARVIAFERNEGQADRRAQFLIRQPGSTVFLTGSEAVFAFDAGRSRFRSPWQRVGRAAFDRRSASAVLRMQLVGAAGRPVAVGEKPLASRTNFFVGSNPRRWRAGVSSFEKVHYRGVYPGIDMVYYGSGSNLEYDLLVAPHGDPHRIGLRFAGAASVRTSRAGDLRVKIAGRELTWRRPTVYQERGGKRIGIPCRYTVSRGASAPTVRFALGRYDSERPLVIDPALVYASFLGGTVGDAGYGVAVDSSGCAYVTGYTSSQDFPSSAGAYQTTNRSLHRSNAFVTKFSADGSTVIYSTLIGGTEYEAGSSIAIDSAGCAYITGETDSLDFPTTTGAFQSTNLSGTTAFVAKLSAAGDSLVYSTYLGGTGGETGNGIAVDSSGSAYVVGFTSSTDYPTTTGAFQLSNLTSYNTNAFVTKLNPAGTALAYSTYLGGTGYESAGAVAVDSTGAAYVTGYTGSADFPTTSGAYQTANRSSSRTNAFVTRLNPAGAALLYSTYLGGSGSEQGNAIAVDASGNAYVTGSTLSADFPTTEDAFQRSNVSAGGSTVFLSKLNATGTALSGSTYLGGTGYESGTGIAIDASGAPIVTGYTVSTDYPTTAGANQTTKRSISANLYGFVTRVNPAFTALLYSTYLGGSTGDRGNAVAIDATGNAYVTGSATSADFPVTQGAFQPTERSATSGNGFVVKLNPNVAVARVSVDFNGDGKSDLLLQNPTTGQITAWYMNAFNRVGGADFSINPGAAYQLIGKGDFAGNGSVALVLQNKNDNRAVYWYADGLNHATITGGDNVFPTPPSAWKIVGIGDFNADGQSDLVLQNQSTNQIAIWFMDGPYYNGGVLMPYTPVAGWQVAGVGDFNRDGNPDIVFQNQSTGQIVIWYMNGSDFSSGALVNTTVASNWKVVAVGDYNGDGIADLVLQDQNTGLAAVWFMSGSTYLGGSGLATMPPPGWRIAGPR